MRSFSFTAKNIGDERYLTYTMGEGMELDEDVLDYCEENDLSEIVKIIYEEDDDFDYLTYDVTGLMSLDDISKNAMKEDAVLKILRNVSLGMISIKENALPLSYIILNKNFMYINPDTFDIQFLYLPVEGEASVSSEFKSFVRQFIANLKYNVDEDLSYVGKLLTYINGDGFNLRGLIGLTEALMKDSGIAYEAGSDISTDDGAEIVDSMDPSAVEEDKTVSDIMSDLGEADEKLPEIGDDEDDSDIELEDAKTPEPSYDVDKMLDDQLKEEAARMEEARLAREKLEIERMIAEKEARLEAERIAAEKEAEERRAAVEAEEAARAEAARLEEERIAAEKAAAEQAAAEQAAAETESEAAEADQEEESGELTPEQIAEEEAIAREVAKKAAREAAEGEQEEEIHEDGTGITITQPVRVSRAAMLKAAAEQAEKEAEAEAEKEAAEAEKEAEAEAEKEEKPKRKKKEKEITEDMADVKKDAGVEAPPKKQEVVDNTILGAAGAIKINPYLVRVNTEEKIIINKPVFKIGKASRGVDFHVSGNGAVSRQHAIILHKGDSYYIKDNKSTNHTYVDGAEVPADEEVLLKNNSTISLGDEDFTFKLG